MTVKSSLMYVLFIIFDNIVTDKFKISPLMIKLPLADERNICNSSNVTSIPYSPKNRNLTHVYSIIPLITYPLDMDAFVFDINCNNTVLLLELRFHNDYIISNLHMASYMEAEVK